MIDLHIHSTFSDGTDTPEEIVEKAYNMGLSAIALTDHDIIDGLFPFQKAAKQYPSLRVLNGCELAVSHPYATVEIIALEIMDVEAFRRRQDAVEQKRHEANLERINMLQKQGIDISFEEVSIDKNGNSHRLVGRPHFAQALVKKGYAESINDAFQRFLGENGSAYIKRDNPSVKETIEFVNNSGAVSILAHPALTGVEREDLIVLIKELKGYGLQGIECYHSEHSDAQTLQYLKIASDLGLKVSGGSDYHGLIKPDISLGYGKGNLNIPDSVLDNLLGVSKSGKRTNRGYNGIER